MRPSPIEKVSVITTGRGSGHHEHVYGTNKPTLWWIFFGKRRITLPIRVYAIEHPDGLVLFDTGVDTRVVTDPDYWPDPITALFMRHIFEWDIEPSDRLGRQLELAGYAPSDVSKAVISHLHSDHVGGIGDIPQADLYVASEAWEHMLGRHPEREMVMRRDIAVLGAKWNPIEFTPTTDPLLSRFGGVFDLMGDESMVVVPTPGHLDGSVSMLVRRAIGPPLLLVGDLTYAEELLDRDQVPGTGNPVLLRQSFAKVRALKAQMPDLIILPAHDPLASDKLEVA
jgi:glyoxylase-like metal-dependent hydrolase (beta-lactamase superfamily II)